MLWGNIVRNDPVYFIWHLGNKCVLARTESSAVAQAASEGLLNSEIAIHFPDSPAGDDEALAAEYQIYDVFNFKIISGAPPDANTQRMISLAKTRVEHLVKLELLIHKYQMRFVGSYDPEFYAWLGAAIANSNADKVDILIEEYAIIQNIDHAAAYYDLKMRWDSYALVKMKAFSFFEKFKRQINESYTSDEMTDTINRCRYELFFSAKI
jgi:hypothetical protein